MSDNHSVTGESRGITGPFKRATGTGAFSTQNLGNGGDFPRGCAGQFRETDGLRQHWGRQQLSPWCLFCVLQLRAFQCVDRRWLWDDIAPMPELRQPLKPGVTGIRQGLRSCSCCTAILPADEPVCPRCSTKGYVRRRNSLQWTLALLVTSIMLYLPANILPIMVTDLLGSKMPSTILAGVILLWSEGSYPVAAVIFLASIMVPTLKMIAIAWLCWDAKGHGKRDSERMHLIYEVVEFVGRWSMIDVFVIAVLSALVRMGGLMSIYPAMGALMFALVVIMTMFSAMTFDPRLSWDRQPESEHEES